MKTAIVIPAFDEAETVGAIVRQAVAKGGDPVIVVDDGSADGTAEAARAAGATVVRHPINRGAGAATSTGLKAALALGAEAVITLDADGQHDPAEIEKLTAVIEEGRADVVVGVRTIGRGRMPVVVRCFNTIANIVTWVISGVWCRDSQSGFRGYSRRALEKIDLRSSGFEFCSEISREVARTKLLLAQVPVTAHYFERGSRKGQNYSTGIETAMRLVIRSLMR